MSYLMGWGNHFESHHYVSIYSDAIISALKDKYPGLRNPSHKEVSGDIDNEQTHIITMVSGVITLKDQLHEKAERKDGVPANQLQASTGAIQRLGGRPLNPRVPYRQGFNKTGHCRIFRTEGHETLPQFVGSWMPRSNKPQDREIYCASMLALLKPWNNLSELKMDLETFEHSFNGFVDKANKKTHNIIKNIQYYYECYEGAKKHREDAMGDGGGRTIDLDDEADIDDLTSSSQVFHLEALEPTEDNILLAYESRGTMCERLYVQVTMNTAIECGVFSEFKSQTTFLANADKANANDLEIFHGWEEQLKAITRKSAENGTPALFAANDDVPRTSCDMGEGVEQILQDDHYTHPSLLFDQQNLFPQHKRDLLNEDQRRAHDIVERQLVK
ncbi:hypothetical protein BYT27DRAFT_7262020 [Phlegmacium glaucopus]|nr:hypothetical protein BYT27DRAFT_7262020 [Phlegmacium glaucopus]